MGCQEVLLLSIPPINSPTSFNLGRIYLKKKMYVEAREEFGKSLIIDSTYLPTKEALELLEQAGIKGI